MKVKLIIWNMNIKKKLEAELNVSNAIKEMDTDALLVMEKSYGDVNYSNSCEDMRLVYDVIVKELNNRGIFLK